MSIKAWAENDRPREKLLEKGRGVLSNAELIAILLGSGSKESSAVELAKQILNSANHDLNSLGKLSVHDLMEFRGVGEAKAISIIAAMELGRRRIAQRSSDKVKISSSKDAYELINVELEDKPFEEFWILLLNRSNRVIGKQLIGKGGVSETLADPKLIFHYALGRLASSIILAHNHPSGNIIPSQADISLTRKIKKAGDYLDISILDHIIVGDNKYYSFADQGTL